MLTNAQDADLTFSNGKEDQVKTTASNHTLTAFSGIDIYSATTVQRQVVCFGNYNQNINKQKSLVVIYYFVL